MLIVAILRFGLSFSDHELMVFQLSASMMLWPSCASTGPVTPSLILAQT